MTAFKKIIINDLRAYKINVTPDISFLKLIKHILWALIYFPGFACVFLFRINHLLYKKSWPFWKLMNVLRFYIFKNEIHCAAEIGYGFEIAHPADIVIGKNAIIGNNCLVYNGVTLGNKWPDLNEMPTLGDNIFIGTGAKLIGGINIGNNVVIGALTLCNKSVPDNSVVYGNPPIIKPLKQNNFLHYRNITIKT
jgi:serine O-acetyltransferase